MAGKPIVAYYLPRFPRLTETFILREMLILRQQGVDVQIFSLAPPATSGTMHPQVQELMPSVHYSPYLFSYSLILAQFYFLFHSPLRYWKAFFHAVWLSWREPWTLARVLLLFPKSVAFARQLEQMKASHIHAHFVWVNAIAAQVAADLTGISYSVHAHAWDIFMRHPDCIRKQILLAPKIVTISAYHRQFLLELCPEKSSDAISVVHCGIDPAEFLPAESRMPGQAMTILSIGSLYEKKGHAYLIQACALLKQQGRDFQCWIVGDGYLKAALAEQIIELGLQEQVQLLGPKNQTEVYQLLRLSDLGVLPCVTAKDKDKDGIPVALMEMMAMQLPCVSTSVAGIPELIQDGETGLLVPERDAPALAQALGRLMDHERLRVQLGCQGRAWVSKAFNIHQTADQMAAIFQKLAGPSSPTKGEK